MRVLLNDELNMVSGGGGIVYESGKDYYFDDDGRVTDIIGVNRLDAQEEMARSESQNDHLLNCARQASDMQEIGTVLGTVSAFTGNLVLAAASGAAGTVGWAMGRNCPSGNGSSYERGGINNR